MKRVIGYVAASSENSRNGFGLVAQREMLERYAEDTGLRLVAIYHDTETTGQKGLLRAADAMRAGMAEAVVFCSPSLETPTLLAA